MAWRAVVRPRRWPRISNAVQRIPPSDAKGTVVAAPRRMQECVRQSESESDSRSARKLERGWLYPRSREAGLVWEARWPIYLGEVYLTDSRDRFNGPSRKKSGKRPVVISSVVSHSAVPRRDRLPRVRSACLPSLAIHWRPLYDDCKMVGRGAMSAGGHATSSSIPANTGERGGDADAGGVVGDSGDAHGAGGKGARAHGLGRRPRRQACAGGRGRPHGRRRARRLGADPGADDDGHGRPIPPRSSRPRPGCATSSRRA